MQNGDNLNHLIIFGKHGQLAFSLKQHLIAKSDSFNNVNNLQFNQFSSSEVDFNNIFLLESFLDNLNPPKIIINTTAFTNVDLAESKREEANNINHLAVLSLANYAGSLLY